MMWCGLKVAAESARNVFETANALHLARNSNQHCRPMAREDHRMHAMIFELIQIVWIAYYILGTAIFVGVVYVLDGWKKRLLGGAIVVALFGFLPLKLRIDYDQKEAEMIARNKAMNAQFTKRCTEDARLSIKRVIENVDGVFIMKPRKVATGTELQDQFWKGDPYGYSSFEARYPHVFLSYGNRGRFKFVEYPNEGFKDAPGHLPFVRLEGYEIDKNGNYQQHKKTYVSSRASKYGFDWEDISTPEDREFWIAGGRTRIVDLETNEVIAERIGYLIDPEQGGRVGRDTWRHSNDNSCPKLVDDFFKNREFIYQILKPSQGRKDGP